MHYFYKYITHPIEKLQEYLDFIFLNVWYNASGTFDANNLNGHLELKQIYIDLGNSDSIAADLFNSSIEKIFEEFTKLSQTEKDVLRQGYLVNNNIEDLCLNKTSIPVLYAEIKVKHPILHDLFKRFFGKLYGSESPFNLKIFGQLSKELINIHYKDFMDVNKKRKCPFCGLNNIKGNLYKYREAYDHFLPKALYPFNSINFRNLAPMCNECNSTYKKTAIPINTKNPLKSGSIRQKAYYPYSNLKSDYQVEVAITRKDVENLSPSDIRINFKTATQSEEVDAWKRVYGIDERYKAMLCHPEEGKVWISTLIDEVSNADELEPGSDFASLYKTELRRARRNPLTSYGFLKAPFLEECKSKGVFDHV